MRTWLVVLDYTQLRRLRHIFGPRCSSMEALHCPARPAIPVQSPRTPPRTHKTTRLDVAVYELHAVEVLHRPRHVQQDVQRGTQVDGRAAARQRAVEQAAADGVAQRAAVAVL